MASPGRSPSMASPGRSPSMASPGRNVSEPPAGPPAHPGDWVQVHKIVLPAGERASAVPPETQAVPLEMLVKGFLTGGEAHLGQDVTVKTLSGRLVTGRLVAVRPPIPHTFGAPVPELLGIGPELRERLRNRPPPEEGHRPQEEGH